MDEVRLPTDEFHRGLARTWPSAGRRASGYYAPGTNPLSAAPASLESKGAWIIARDISRRIVEGWVDEGDLLPSEADLMRHYRVSRAVLREAVRLLEWDSFVTIRRGSRGGAVVTLPDVRVAARYGGLLLQSRGATLEDIDRALRTVEPEIVWMSAKRRSRPTDLLEESLQEQAQTMASPEFAAAGRRFHEFLPSVMGNQALTVLLRMVREIRERHNVVALSGMAEIEPSHRRTVASHARLIDLIRGGYAEEARDLWVRHLGATSRALASTDAKTVLDLFSGSVEDFDLTYTGRGEPRRTRIPKGSDIIARELRRRILTGELGEQDTIPTESSLMEEFGLSRPSVREALRILEAEHLVELVRGTHRGGRIRTPKLDTAVWQTGVLLQMSKCSVGEVVQAQAILERCSSRLLTEPRLPELARDLEELRTRGRDAGPVDGLTDFELFATLADHITNQTMRCLSGIGRSLVRRARLADPTDPHTERSLAKLARLASKGDLASVSSTWEREAARFYTLVESVGDLSATVDMFG